MPKKPIIEIAYVCNGKDPDCTKEGCYFKNHGPCCHTRNIKYARHKHWTPKKYPERFDIYKSDYGGEMIVRYYEKTNLDKDKEVWTP